MESLGLSSSFLDLSQFTDPGRLGPREEGACTIAAIIIKNLRPSLPQGDRWPYTRVRLHLTFRALIMANKDRGAGWILSRAPEHLQREKSVPSYLKPRSENHGASMTALQDNVSYSRRADIAEDHNFILCFLCWLLKYNHN